MTKQIKTLFDLQPDEENINQQTKRSYNELSDSHEYCGWGRDIVVDKNGNVIAGNGNLEVTMDRYEGEPPEPIIVQTDGKRPIIHQRTDLDLYDDKDDRARTLSYYDNATTRHSQWNRTNVAVALQKGRDLRRVFTDEELELLTADKEPKLQDNTAPPPRVKVYFLNVQCSDEDDLSSLANRLMEEGYDVKPVVKSQ